MIEKKQYIYRLVDDRTNVLYIGQHTGIHPGTRVARHKDRPWWHEVAAWDYEEVTGDLATAEKELMCFWGAYYNKENLKWRAEIEAKSTVDLIFEAGEAAGSYNFSGGYDFAGHLKLIRTVLWRRDKTVVPRGSFFSETPRDFSQDWDFADFPVLSPNGFITTMGSVRPMGLTGAHPECAFELDYWPVSDEDDQVAWEDWLDRAIKDGQKISYTGIHKQPARRLAA